VIALSWQNDLKDSICTIEDLSRNLILAPKEQKQVQRVIDRHPMRIPHYYFSLVDGTNPDDPIRRLVVPSDDELDLSGSYDTSGEIESTKMPGLQHKYPQTALILATNRCAAYCRYCFRKRLVGLPGAEIVKRLEMASAYVRKHSEITNVLISGGDPLILPTEMISRLLDQLTGIDHLDFIRIGTRIPVVLPQRITEDDDLVSLLQSVNRERKRIYIVTQFNHQSELTNIAVRSVRKILRAGIGVSNQTVLLKGVNESPGELAALMKRLVRTGIAPYYVFQCRPVKRVKKRFQLPLSKGYEVVEEAKKLLDGHSKRFRYVMSHRTGKIEIVGIRGDEMLFKYHQTRNPELLGQLFSRKFSPTAGWLDDLEETGV
jgi:lysine 2,3-aminomutase